MNSLPGYLRIIRRGDLEAEPWKNGQGQTREIWRDDQLGIRISLADVEQDGPFSEFPNRLRILTVVSGQGFTLKGAEEELIVDPLEPLLFSGAKAFRCALRDGPVQNLNVILDPDRCDAVVSVAAPGRLLDLSPSGAAQIVVHIADGACDILGHSLETGDTMILQDGMVLEAAADTKLVIVSVSPRRSAKAIHGTI